MGGSQGSRMQTFLEFWLWREREGQCIATGRILGGGVEGIWACFPYFYKTLCYSTLDLLGLPDWFFSLHDFHLLAFCSVLWDISSTRSSKPLLWPLTVIILFFNSSSKTPLFIYSHFIYIFLVLYFNLFTFVFLLCLFEVICLFQKLYFAGCPLCWTILFSGTSGASRGSHLPLVLRSGGWEL